MTVTQVLRALWSSIPVSAFMEGTVPLLGMTDTLERAKKAVLDSSARCAVVLDALHHPVNIVTRSDLIRFSRKKVVLVDHNEPVGSTCTIIAELCRETGCTCRSRWPGS